MAQLQSLLFELTNALLYPVVVGLLLLIAWSLVALGGFVREGLGRRRGGAARVTGLLGATRGRAALDALEQRLARRLDALSFASRLGPMLGLAGTLIPLGPGLKALGDGQMAAFADNLVVAFSTTVAGLLACGVCLWIATVRGRWYESDLRALERALDEAAHD